MMIPITHFGSIPILWSSSITLRVRLLGLEIEVSRVALAENGLKTLASTTMFNPDNEIGIAVG
jgi:hypothetical protein